MTITTQVFATTLLTATLLASAMWANGIPPVGAHTASPVGARPAPPVAACLDTRAKPAVAPLPVVPVASAMSCR